MRRGPLARDDRTRARAAGGGEVRGVQVSEGDLALLARPLLHTRARA